MINVFCRLSEIDRENAIYMAQVAEVAERFDDMVEYVKKYLVPFQEGCDYIVLSEKEKNLFSIAYKSVSTLKRNSLRILVSSKNSKELMEKSDISEEIEGFVNKLKTELKQLCDEVVDYCNKIMENPSLSPADSVFYNKMVGDYDRYIAEFMSGEEKDNLSKKADEAYKKAREMGEKGNLSPVSPAMLGLALNHSVYYYEIVGDAETVSLVFCSSSRLVRLQMMHMLKHMLKSKKTMILIQNHITFFLYLKIIFCFGKMKLNSLFQFFTFFDHVLI